LSGRELANFIVDCASPFIESISGPFLESSDVTTSVFLFFFFGTRPLGLFVGGARKADGCIYFFLDCSSRRFNGFSNSAAAACFFFFF